MPEIEPLEPPYEPLVAEQLVRLMGTPEREPLRLFRTLVKNPGLARGFEALGGHNLSRGTLPVRDRELMILRTTALCRCAYEWGVHARVYAKAARLSPDEVRNKAAGSAETFSGKDRLRHARAGLGAAGGDEDDQEGERGVDHASRVRALPLAVTDRLAQPPDTRWTRSSRCFSSTSSTDVEPHSGSSNAPRCDPSSRNRIAR